MIPVKIVAILDAQLLFDSHLCQSFLFDENLCPLNQIFLGNRKKSLGARSTEYGDQFEPQFVNLCHGDHRYSIFFIFTKTLTSTSTNDCQTTTEYPK